MEATRVKINTRMKRAITVTMTSTNIMTSTLVIPTTTTARLSRDLMAIANAASAYSVTAPKRDA